VSEFCVCEDGTVLVDENQACPSSESSEDDELFDCSTCDGGKPCVEEYDPLGGREAGCYCDELLLDPADPCYHHEEAPLVCDGYDM
jgi:hypothetical protein